MLAAGASRRFYLNFICEAVHVDVPVPRVLEARLPPPPLVFRSRSQTLLLRSSEGPRTMLPTYKRDLNGHAPSPETPASYYYGDEDFRPPAPEDVSEKLKQAQKTTVGRVADLISHEVEGRRNMIGGIDNFWLLLQDITDFNPVCP